MLRNTRSAHFSADALNKANQALNQMIGCWFAEKRRHDLERALVKCARELSEPDPASLGQRIIANALRPGELEALADQLISGETSFFRDQETMHTLQCHVLPSLIEENRDARKLAIWCTACSSGEEPLTMAMLLKEHKVVPSHWQVRILGTDLRQRALDAARQGLYREWSFRGCPPAIREAHFSRSAPGEYRVHPALHKQVEFAKLNLVLDPIPSPLLPEASFDLILCRNVLIYLSAERVQEVLAKCHRCLRPGGWLVVAAAEAASVGEGDFERIQIQRVTLFKKPTGPNASQCVSTLPAATFSKAKASLKHEKPPIKKRRTIVDADSHLPKLRQEPARPGKHDLDARRYRREAAASLESGDLLQARECLQRALFLDRQQPLGHFLKSQLHRLEGNYPAAAGSLRTARRLLETMPLDLPIDEDTDITPQVMLNLIRQANGRHE